MSAISSNSQSSSASSPQVGNSIETLDLDVFLDLMLTELQQQDPLDPMDNQEMLNTISQIREISANDKLSETLESVLLGQNVATAAGLIGKEVEGLTGSGQRVVGAVNQVLINDGAPELEIAVETSAGAGSAEGEVPAGEYSYEVVWETDDGVFSVQASVDTEDLGEDFKGSIRINNLPAITNSTPRKVFRSDGSGDPKLVGVLPTGGATSFTDTLPNERLGDETLTGQRSVLRFADSVRIKLSNVSSVQTLQ